MYKTFILKTFYIQSLRSDGCVSFTGCFCVQVVCMLVSAHPNLMTSQTRLHTPLHLAARNGHHSTIQTLLEAGMEVNCVVSWITARFWTPSAFKCRYKVTRVCFSVAAWFALFELDVPRWKLNWIAANLHYVTISHPEQTQVTVGKKIQDEASSRTRLRIMPL